MASEGQSLPRGTLRTSASGAVEVRLEVAAGEQRDLERLVERFGRLDPARFLAPEHVAWHGEGVTLRYPREPEGTIELAEAIARWQEERGAHLPIFLDLTRFLLETGRALAAAELGAFAFAPVQLRYAKGGERPFRVLLFPVPTLRLEDWARADELSWGWLTPAALLRDDPRGAQAHSIAAALHTCLAPLFPEGSPAECFRRVLEGRSLAEARLSRALDGVIPRGLESERHELATWITSAMKSPASLDARWHEQLVSLHQRLSPERLAARWEYERQSTLARRVLEVAASHHAIAWDGLARLRAREGQWSGAIEAALAALGEAPDVGPVFDALALVRHIPEPSQRGGAAVRVVEAIDDRLERGGVHPLALEEITLHLADLELRVVGDAEAARRRLDVTFTVPWNQALRAVILGHAFVRAGENVRASKLCAEGRALVLGMSNHGGPPGRWAIAYFAYLEGIANFGAVAMFSDTSYLADAYEAFVRAVDGAIDAYGAKDPLVEGGAAWLRWLVAFAASTRAPNLATVKMGVEAYLRARQLGVTAPERAPLLMFYDAGVLLPLSQRL
ncbi:MAG: hypothetical protein U0234_10015 [Sandaracinus sp.]